MPFDMDKTRFGFPFILFGQQIGAFSASMCSTLTIMMQISLNFYVMASIDDMHASVNRLDDLLLHGGEKNVELAHRKLVEILNIHWWIIQ